jgi:hypothetical protein
MGKAVLGGFLVAATAGLLEIADLVPAVGIVSRERY